MTLTNCTCRCKCSVAALIISAVVGVITAFLQIAGVITVTPVFLWVTFGIAIVYLGLLLLTTALAGNNERQRCACIDLTTLLVGILGTILFAAVLLAVGIVATSFASAILLGLLLFFFALALTATACLAREIMNCAA